VNVGGSLGQGKTQGAKLLLCDDDEQRRRAEEQRLLCSIVSQAWHDVARSTASGGPNYGGIAKAILVVLHRHFD